MNHSRSARTSCLLAAAAFSAALTFHSPPAEAKLVLETRFVGHTGSGETVQVGDVMNFDVFAVVTGRNTDLTDEPSRASTADSSAATWMAASSAGT